MLATFFVQVQLKKFANGQNISIFSGCFVCGYAGCSHPASGRISLKYNLPFIGSRYSMLTTDILFMSISTLHHCIHHGVSMDFASDKESFCNIQAHYKVKRYLNGSY